MKYFIDFTTKIDKYEHYITSLYFNDFKDYIFNLSTFYNHDFYKVSDHGVSYGWEEEDLIKQVGDLIK